MTILFCYIRQFSERSFEHLINTNAGELKPVPNYIIWLVFYLCVSVLMQGIADIVLKVLSLAGSLPVLPWRTDFLFLTAISVLMGYRTLTGMLHRKFDVTRNSIEVGILVEIALVVGDSLFVANHLASIPHIVMMRMPFILLTLINITILLYVYHVLQCRSWQKKARALSLQWFGLRQLAR